MPRVLKYVVAAGFAVQIVLVSGCAPTLKQAPIDRDLAAAEARKQREMALDLSIKRTDRLLRISFPMLRAATDLCEEQIKAIGMVSHDLSIYEGDYVDAAASLYGLGTAVVVRQVQPGFPAAEAGVAVGDTILKIGEHAIRGTEDVIKRMRQTAEKEDAVAITLGNQGATRVVVVPFVPIVRYPVLLAPDDIVNAYADGDNVYIATGMMRFTESDQELALVIGHELAHNCLGHIGKKQNNFFLGSLVDVLVTATTGVNTGNVFGEAAAQTFSQEFESEADYMGLYLAKRAGHDIASAPQFWRRMAAEHPGSIQENFSASHPSTAERFLALENAVAEIDRKAAAGEPLAPETK